MKPFEQDLTGYTADAKYVTFSAGDTYDVAKLDNPVRKKVNYALIAANHRNYRLYATV